MNECIIFKVSLNKKGYFVSLYRSPPESYNDSEDFLFKFDQLLSDIITRNPKVVLIAGDF